MGEEIFRHVDHDNDMFRLERSPVRADVLRAYVDSSSGYALLGRDEVLPLIQALTEWAYPTHTPEGPNRSLIEELIAKAVKDQVAAVLPLHLSPVVTCRGGYGCDALGEHPAHGSGCGRPDPEPGDVGHPETCALSQPIFRNDDSRCSECGGRWADHPGVQAARAEWAAVAPAADCDTPRPTSDLPFTAVHDVCGYTWATHKQSEPQSAEDSPCADCGHAKDRHRPACAVFEAGKGVCRCNAYKAPLPVREKTVIVPVCGLCKQPWSDGHGQPGDPCPGVEAARGDAGDWTDALWRVQPSAPASEARYCDECGHSWESHRQDLGKCASIVGKSACGCFARRPE